MLMSEMHYISHIIRMTDIIGVHVSMTELNEEPWN